MPWIPLLLLTCGLAAPQAPARAAFDWPQFQGPERSGVSTESAWSSQGAAAPLWTVNVGRGYSCPSIVAGRLVTQGHDAENGSDHVLCLAADTGEELWRHSYPATDDPQYHGGGSLTTPAIADGVVYTLNRHGRAFALRLEDGAVLWERDYKAELELPKTFHGYCASPIVEGDRIVYVFGGSAACAKRDGGDIVWRSADAGDGSYSNPSVFELRGRTCVAVMLAQTFFVLDLIDGAVLHELPWRLNGNAVHVATPLVLGDRVLLSTAYGKGAGMLRLGEAREPEVLWTSRRMRNKVTGLVPYEEHVYGFDESILKCMDLEGSEQWRVRGLGMGALSIVGGRLLVVSSSGELIVAEATPAEFRELARTEVLEGGSYWTMPVLVGGLVYMRNSLGDLACLDHRGAAGALTDAGEPGPSEPGAAAGVPAAATLFEAHAAASGGAVIRAAAGLRLKGEWEILGRGMSRTPMTLTLGAPNRWRLGLDEGSLVDTFDGELGWELKNGGTRLFDETEASDAPSLFALAELFAPACPPGASVGAEPVRFGGALCWRVASAAADGAAPSAVHFFEVDGGRLVGREGDLSTNPPSPLATTIFAGVLSVGDARLPARVAIYRTGSGQEETLYLKSGEWIEPGAELFERTPAVLRLLRTPAELAAETKALRARYAKELGRYRVEIEFISSDVLEVRAEKGELWCDFGDGPAKLTRVSESEPTFAMGDWGARLTFEYEEDGSVRAARVEFGPDAFELPRIE